MLEYVDGSGRITLARVEVLVWVWASMVRSVVMMPIVIEPPLRGADGDGDGDEGLALRRDV